MTLYSCVSIIKNILRKSNLLMGLKRKLRYRELASVRDALQVSGIDTLFEINAALKESGVQCVVAFGTLLGCVRENGILKHDFDIDLLVQMDSSFNWTDVETALSSRGYSKLAEYRIDGRVTEQTYSANGFAFDVFGADVIDGKMRCFFYSRLAGHVYNSPKETSVKYMDIPRFEKVRDYQVQGRMIPVPDNYEVFLETVYGSSWRIPDPNWESGYGWIWIPEADALKVEF